MVPRRGPRFRVYLNPYIYRHPYLLTHSLVSVALPFARLECSFSAAPSFFRPLVSLPVLFFSRRRPARLFFRLVFFRVASVCLPVPFSPFCLLRFVIPVACRVSVALASAPVCAARSLFLCARRLVLPPLSFARCCLPLLSPRFASPFAVCLVLSPVPAPPVPALRVLPLPLLPFSSTPQAAYFRSRFAIVVFI